MGVFSTRAAPAPRTPRSCPLPADRLRLQRGAEHLHRLGARPVAEFLSESARARDDFASMLCRLDAWRELSPELVHAVGGDLFPPELQAVPDDLNDNPKTGRPR